MSLPKKWSIAITTAFFILLFALPYILIPQTLTVSNSIKIDRNARSASRILINRNNWVKWWPSGKTGESETELNYKGNTYEIGEEFYYAIAVSILENGIKRNSRLDIIPLHTDSIILVWKYGFSPSLNPVKRIKEYYQASKTGKDMQDIMALMKKYLVNPENIYGLNVKLTMSKDSTLIFTKFLSRSYPSTKEIYQAIAGLKSYIQTNRAKENNYPMLRVEKTENNSYEAMIAIPVNKELKSRGKFIFKRFVPWKVLTAEVQGDNSTINQGFQQFLIYIQDYHYSQMAVPFESLVTDRSKEKDSTKWITRFYCPVS